MKEPKGKSEHVFEKVFTPLEVRGKTLQNRIVFPAFQTNYATSEGFVTKRIMNFYQNIAKGGAGLIITGGIAVNKESVGAKNILQLTKAGHEGGLEKLFREIKSHGAVVGAQLVHFGRQTSSSITGYPLVAASAIPCPLMKEMPRELSEEEIFRIEDDFTAAALRAKNAGVDLVEIHAAYGYLLGGFLSPYSNKRTDNYGGSRENRTRIVREIIEQVRSKAGDLILCCRISADEFVEGGLTLEETKKIAPMLEDAGMDLISVAAGVYQSMNHMLPTKEMGDAPHVYLAAGIKEVVDVPVICVGNIRNLSVAEAILADGKADLVAMARAQVADPEIVNKSLEGLLDSIVACSWCNQCFYVATGDPAVSCPNNPNL
jgi:2,4-dienoyl-CoA reductase-like NADH-dependent reductase (Old Yellow Enzyme family)